MSIKPCENCTIRNLTHPFQDSYYGLYNRVHNYAIKGYSGNPGWRCTICLNVRPAGRLEKPMGKASDD
jgi:hypothetical protein